MARNDKFNDPKKKLLDEIVVNISRVTKVTKGGRHMRFSATMAVGDGKGLVGIGSGKAIERWQRAAHNGFKIWADNEYGSRCYSENYTPKAGDVIIFSWSHVGLVYGCDGNYVYCVEGNSTTNDYNTSKVSLSKYSLSSGNIYGYYPTSEKIN